MNRQVIATTDQEDHYGLNFGERLKKKISLMEKYGGRLPYIDPNTCGACRKEQTWIKVSM